VQYGVIMFPADYALPVVELGREVEQRGFESLFLPEHTHIPASRRTPYPGGGDLPEYYWHTLDPFVALAAVAASTERLLVGTGVCLVIERDPIVTAKEVASLDLLSGGRFRFGVGAGWNREEMANHGTNPATRMALFRERMHAMRAIWTEQEASFHGRYVDFDRIWSWPKPVTRPHPPILVGGGGPTVLDRVLDFGDEWMPNRIADEEEFGRRIDELRQRAGRHVPVSVFGGSARPEALAGYARIGVDRVLFYVPPAGREEVLPRLDQFADAASSGP
jgi:probable F420-dependent oxidoreductase